jgi:PDZ domain-containing secreted protein
LHSWNLNEYALTPGNATPVAPLVKVEGVATATHHDKIMLTDVYLSSLNAWQWLTLHFSSHVQFVGADELVEPGVPTDELGAQGYLEMSDSKQAAEVSAFKALGWKTPGTPTGAVVTAVIASSPARSAGIHIADEIVGVNGTVVTSSCTRCTTLRRARRNVSPLTGPRSHRRGSSPTEHLRASP